MLTAAKGPGYDLDGIAKTTFEYNDLGYMVQTTPARQRAGAKLKRASRFRD